MSVVETHNGNPPPRLQPHGAQYRQGIERDDIIVRHDTDIGLRVVNEARQNGSDRLTSFHYCGYTLDSSRLTCCNKGCASP